jgi:hypothetical protein
MCPRTALYVSSYCYICVIILDVSSYRFICVLILLYMSSYRYICSSYCFMCPPTAIYVSSYYYMCAPAATCDRDSCSLYASSYYFIYVLLPLYTCPHTTIRVHLLRLAIETLDRFLQRCLPGTQRLRCQYLYFRTSNASTFVPVKQVYLASSVRTSYLRVRRSWKE